MKNKRLFLVLIVAVLAAMTLNAEGQKDSGADASTTKTFAIVYPIVHPFFEPVTCAAEKYAAGNGWKVIKKALI